MSDARTPPGRSASKTDLPAQGQADRPSNPGGSAPRASNPGLPAQRASNPGLPAQPRASNPSLPAQGQPRASNPNLKVISAARAAPPPAEPKQDIKQRLKSGAEDTALNVVSILKDAFEDFKRSDRYFKYKAGILAGWLMISVVTIFASCPPSELDAKNRLGARLGPRSPDPTRPAITIFNDSDKPWHDVIITVNKSYRAAITQVDAQGGAVTITPKQLLGPGGMVAPSDLNATDVEIKTDDGKALLMKNGQEQ